MPPTEDFSLAEYLDAAHEKILDIKSRGKQVLFVGGTALYLKSLLRGVYQGPPPDWEFREAIEKELAVVGLPELHKRLKVIDPLLGRQTSSQRQAADYPGAGSIPRHRASLSATGKRTLTKAAPPASAKSSCSPGRAKITSPAN